MDRIGETVRKKGKVTNPFLPDELIPNILSRLPVESAIRCRLVCRRWRDLTLERDFADLQSRRNRNIPTILVSNPKSYEIGLDLFALDKWWEPAETSFTFPIYAGKLPISYHALFSHAGLVVFRQKEYRFSDLHFTILNPTSRENVKITLPNKLGKSMICGVYFHPSLKEYCSLWSIDGAGDFIQYKILTLGSKSSFKNLSNPFSNRCIKEDHTNQLLINDYLYWMLEPEQGFTDRGCNDIMEFDINSEEFNVMSCPMRIETECNDYQTHLLNIDGILSYLLIIPFKIAIWRLEDRAEKIWKAVEYTFSIETCPSLEFSLLGLGAVTFSIETCPSWGFSLLGVGAVAVVDGKLPLFSNRRLFVCDIMEGKVKKVKNYEKIKYRLNVVFLSHQMSLASLRNCKSTILIGEDGQVVEV